VASPPQGNSEAEEVSGTHTFKIVTTKRTLLLCAPSEDDEIKWMGAIRALIARRMESGLVPGKVSKAASAAPSQGPGLGYGNEGSSGGAASGAPPQAAPATSVSGLKGKVRRLSGAGHHPEQEVREARTS